MASNSPGFEEWRSKHSPFVLNKDPNSTNQLWRQKLAESETEAEFYRSKMNETQSDLVSLKQASLASEQKLLRDKAESDLLYEIEMNNLRRDKISHLEQLEQLKEMELKERLDLRRKVFQLELG